MSDFLLVHGGLHGAWCWEKLTAELEALGHRAHALDLPGAGNDPTPRDKVTVALCLDALDRFIAERKLPHFHLVGHSIAGGLLPQIAARHPGAVEEVVFVAALVLDKGERLIDLIPEERRPGYYEKAEASGDGTLSVGWEEARRRFFNDLTEADARASFAKLTPQPLAVYLEPSPVSARDIAAPKRYVLGHQDVTFAPAFCRELARKAGCARDDIVEIDAGHDIMLSCPAELAGILASPSDS